MTFDFIFWIAIILLQAWIVSGKLTPYDPYVGSSIEILEIPFEFFKVSGLVCHCDICDNGTCMTDGVCFTSTSYDKKTGITQHTYRYCFTISFVWDF